MKNPASMVRKVLLGASVLSCIVCLGTTSNAESEYACRSRVHRAPATRAPRVLRAPAPSALPAPSTQASPGTWSRLEAEALALTNAYRARGAVCGAQAFGPAAPLSASMPLHDAALEHSYDMGARHYFDHRALDGRTPEARMRAAGYGGGYTGENISAGQPTAREIVDGWMTSPGHCANIMSPNYRTVGIGHALVAGSGYGDYWTQDFGG